MSSLQVSSAPGPQAIGSNASSVGPKYRFLVATIISTDFKLNKLSYYIKASILHLTDLTSFLEKTSLAIEKTLILKDKALEQVLPENEDERQEQAEKVKEKTHAMSAEDVLEELEDYSLVRRKIRRQINSEEQTLQILLKELQRLRDKKLRAEIQLQRFCTRVDFRLKEEPDVPKPKFKPSPRSQPSSKMSEFTASYSIGSEGSCSVSTDSGSSNTKDSNVGTKQGSSKKEDKTLETFKALSSPRVLKDENQDSADANLNAYYCEEGAPKVKSVIGSKIGQGFEKLGHGVEKGKQLIGSSIHRLRDLKDDLEGHQLNLGSKLRLDKGLDKGKQLFASSISAMKRDKKNKD